MSDESLLPDYTVLGDDDTEFFRTVHGRTLNTLNPRYMLPVDVDEIKVRTFLLFLVHSLMPITYSVLNCITDYYNSCLGVGTTLVL
jgi:hypothetical protein